MGRFTEKFFHDAPLRPFSDTPDGRTVIELHNRGEKASKFEERSLALQSDTLRALTQLHGGSTVSREDFLANERETQNLLHGLGRGIGELWREQASTTDAVEVLNQITMQASNRAHGDAVALKGSVDGVGSAVRDGTREIHGPRAVQLDISDFASSPQGFFEALSAYKKGILTGKADREIETIIDERLGSEKLRSKVDKIILESIRPGNLYEDHDLPSFLIERPSWLIKEPHKYAQDIKVLSAFANKHKDVTSELKNFINNTMGLLELSNNAQNTPLRKNTLIEYTNDGLLTGYMQHKVKAQHREARTGGSLVDINYSMLESLRQGDIAIQQEDAAIQQRDTANYYLDSIVGELTGTNEHLVNLNHLVADFTDVVESGFMSVVVGLDRVADEVAFARAALTAKLEHVEQTIIRVGTAQFREQKRTNKLLERLVWLQENSHKNEARQHFEDGINCLQKAAVRDDVEDAYTAFDEGAKKFRSSAENQYGAGLAAELLGDLEEAVKRYGKSVRRASGEQVKLTSISHEGLARIEWKRSNLPEALNHSDEAGSVDPDNLPARYDHARYLALMGLTEEALDVLKKLIQTDNRYLLQFRADSSFGQLPLGGVQEMYEELWDSQALREPEIIHWLLDDFLILDDLDYADKIYQHLADFMPQYLLKARIWENKSLARIQDKIKSYFQKVAGEDFPTGSDERRYCFTLLAYCARVSAKDLAHFFVAELNQDPVRWDEEGKEKVIRKLHSLDIEVAEKFLLVVLPHLPQALQNWFSS